MLQKEAPIILRRRRHYTRRVARFFLVKIPKRGKIYQNGEKYTKTGKNIPKRGKIYQNGEKYTKMTTNYTKWP
jgi:hypothetical protein